MLYPQQNNKRNVLDLSGFWNFKLDPEATGEEEGWYDGLTAPRTIAVPASWNELYQDTREYLDTAWYVRECYVPSGWQGQQVYLRIGSANYAAKVWINGQFAGEHQGGHLPFAFEVTEYVTWDAPNTVAIQVDGQLTPTRVPPGNVSRGGAGGFMAGYPNTSFDFFPYTGIQRPVILYALPQTHIEDITVTTAIEGTKGLVTVCVVQSGSASPGTLTLSGENDSLEAGLTFVDGIAEATIDVPDARLWCPEDPYLYTLTVTLNDGNQVVDRYRLEVGIRTIAVESDQILLNGKPILLTGFGRHEDFPVHGRGLNGDREKKVSAIPQSNACGNTKTKSHSFASEKSILCFCHCQR